MDLGRIELPRASAEKRLNPADFGSTRPKSGSRRRCPLSADLVSFHHLVGNPWATLRVRWLEARSWFGKVAETRQRIALTLLQGHQKTGP